ncbi:hypothetical protein GBA65_07100 [Rubrobacter marinus]|uniref:Zinc finger CHC2-type domain-containing protein n=1 Tax=Rubrobacter marinus TaxID=2653852 RepID=A0A6G8PVT8_9ACTN|nr:hypothetical protein [Rubrobacter marinus]QIN78322.1 hypothetical protein GBA65_07100 [Rubrobacter marinus]
MSTRTGNQGSDGMPTSRKRYDKKLVRDRTTELLAIRLGPGKDQGARLVWGCPACGKQDKYSVKRSERKGGCLVEDCRLSGYDDVFGMLAKLEGLDYHADFLAVLAKAYELLGLEPAGGGAEPPAKAGIRKNVGVTPPVKVSSKASSRAVPVRQRAADSKNRERRGNEEDVPENLDARLDLAGRVYRRILELCPLETSDRSYLRARGLSHETIRKGRFGTVTAGRARHLKGYSSASSDARSCCRCPVSPRTRRTAASSSRSPGTTC